MFDGRFRTNIEQAIKPVGANLRKTGITPDHLTVLGILMATATVTAAVTCTVTDARSQPIHVDAVPAPSMKVI